MAITFQVLVDTANDAGYATAITTYVRALSWKIGFANAFDLVARDSTASIIVKNDGRQFSPEHASAISGLTKGRRIKVTSNDGVTTRTHYVGWVESVKPIPGLRRERLSTIRCLSFFSMTHAPDAFVPVQESKTADQVIETLMGNSAIYPPGIPLRWLLGVSGWSEMGETTYLGETADFLSAEVGKTTFNYIGDKWGDGVKVLRALGDIVGREGPGARLFLNRDGLLVFWNRHHYLIDTASDSTFDETMVELAYSWGDRLINAATVTANPRKVGSAPEVLSRNDRPIDIEAVSSREVGYRFTDLTSSGAKIAGKNIIAPVANTDYTANSASDGTGVDYTASVTATVTDNGTRAIVTFTNTAVVKVYVLAGSQVRGTAIRSFGKADAHYDNVDSQALYRYAPTQYHYEQDNITDAQATAEFLATSAGDPLGEVDSFTIRPMSNATMQTHGLTRTIGDRVTLIESQTGMSSDYFIIGEQHEINTHINSWKVTYPVEPAEASQYWVLGVAGFSEVGETTWAGPL